jgi:hypothetical protein
MRLTDRAGDETKLAVLQIHRAGPSYEPFLISGSELLALHLPEHADLGQSPFGILATFITSDSLRPRRRTNRSVFSCQGACSTSSRSAYNTKRSRAVVVVVCEVAPYSIIASYKLDSGTNGTHIGPVVPVETAAWLLNPGNCEESDAHQVIEATEHEPLIFTTAFATQNNYTRYYRRRGHHGSRPFICSG